MEFIGDHPVNLYCLDSYLKDVCTDTKVHLGSRAPKRHWLYVAIVHAHRFDKNADPMCAEPLICDPFDWACKIQNICNSELAPDYLRGVDVLKMLPRSTLYREFKVLSQRETQTRKRLLIKHSNNADSRSVKYEVSAENISCAPCILRNWEYELEA